MRRSSRQPGDIASAAASDGRPSTLARRGRRAGPRRRRQDGYALLVVMLMFTLLVLAMAAAIPRWKTEIQRGREQEAIDRAHQYVEGIKRYYHKFGSYPPNLARLKETNGIHFLRRAFTDPLTDHGDGKWQLLQFSDLKRGEVIGGPPGFNSAGSSSKKGSSTASGVSGSAPGNSLFGAGAETLGSSMSGMSGSMNPGGSLFANSSAPAASDNSSSTSSDAGSNSSSSPLFGSSAAGNGASTATAAHGQVFGGAGIVGVASRSKKLAIHSFNHKDHPNQWQFVYDPMTDRSLVGAAAASGGALPTSTSSPISPASSSTSTGPSSTTGPAGSGGGLFGNSSGPGQ